MFDRNLLTYDAVRKKFVVRENGVRYESHEVRIIIMREQEDIRQLERSYYSQVMPKLDKEMKDDNIESFYLQEDEEPNTYTLVVDFRRGVLARMPKPRIGNYGLMPISTLEICCKKVH